MYRGALLFWRAFHAHVLRNGWLRAPLKVALEREYYPLLLMPVFWEAT